MLIAHPSFSLLYILDEVISPTMTIKAVGHQWYWSYEYTDYETESGDVVEFDVRGGMPNYRGDSVSVHFYNMYPTLILVEGESPDINIA